MGFNKTPHLTFAPPKKLRKLALQRPGLGILEWGLFFFYFNFFLMVLIKRFLLDRWSYEYLCLDLFLLDRWIYDYNFLGFFLLDRWVYECLCLDFVLLDRWVYEYLCLDLFLLDRWIYEYLCLDLSCLTGGSMNIYV